MAHSFVQAHDREADALANFARFNPAHSTLLIDTYDTAAGAHAVVSIVRAGGAVQAVRIDSGDLVESARTVRAILDAGGCGAVRILVSGNLDEHEIARLVNSGAPIDAFGVGTRLDTSADAPYLDCAYKLEEYAGRARRKRSTGKATWPGKKQVFRDYATDGTIRSDVVALESERPGGVPLLECVMRGGQRVRAAETLADITARSARSLESLPAAGRRLSGPEPIEPHISAGIRALADTIDRDRP
jgi:nicotinate phosphoribosyltransferase